MEAELEVLPLTLQLATDTSHTTSGRGRPGHQVQGHRMASPTLPPTSGIPHITERPRWEGLSTEERLQKKRSWVHRRDTLSHFGIVPYGTPPRNAELDVSLDNDCGEEDQEVLDDLEDGEQGERGVEEVEEQAGLAQGSTPRPPVTHRHGRQHVPCMPC